MRLGVNYRRRSFTPTALFRGGYPGLTFDPSDLSTLFQDELGATPVTAPGQSVGMIRDKSGNGKHPIQATPAAKMVYGIMPATGVRNLAENSVWAGATSGAPGTAPTSWTRWTTAPVGTTTISGASATFACAAQRAFFLYAFTAATSTVYSVSVTAVVSSGSLTVAQCIGTTTSIAGATSAYMLNGAAVVGSTSIPAGANRIALIYTTAGTGGSVTVRMGAGITDVATGTVTMRDPQLEIAAAPTAYQARVSATNITEAGVRSLHYLLSDGIDDGLATAAIDFSGTNKMSVFAGIRKSSDAATGMVAELSANLNTNNGSFYMLAPAVNGQASSAFVSKGTVSASAAASTFAAPVTGVLTGLADISGDVVKHRRNGAQVAEAITDQGTGNFGNHALYIGRRGGASLPFNGLIFGLVVVGKTATAAEIARTERFLAYKSGATI